ncbi:penicillin-binding protein [Planctomycetota bacterium]|nr:penicillin-binding protein [Planctomycetota bacterium]
MSTRNFTSRRLLATAWLFCLALTAAAQAPAPLAPGTKAATSLTKEQVTAIAQRAFDAFHPKGFALAVVQDGEVLCELGLGERKTGAPMTAMSLFNIASCSKAFTAALISMLTQDKRLAWDDLVAEKLPKFALADPWITAHLTIADLLSHHCGLATFAGDLLWYGTDYTDDQVVKRMARLPITQRFRDQFGYQNLMYLVAGMILQRITNKPFEVLVEEQLLQPLGMKDSRACAQRLPADAELALPHIDGIEIPDHVFNACKPAGSIYASVHDLTSFLRMLLNDGKHDGKQLLAPQQIAEMWRPHTTLGNASGASTADFRSYGMGWFLSVEQGKKLVEHDGGMPGFLSKVSLLPADRFAFVVLNNANDGLLNEAIRRALLTARAGGDGYADIDRIAKAKERMHAQEQAALAARNKQRIADTKPSLALTAYAGRFEDAVYGPAEIEIDGEQLRITLVPSRTRLFGTLSHWHHDTFRTDFPDRFLPFALVTFALDANGKVNRFSIDCPIADFDFGALDFRRVKAGQ